MCMFVTLARWRWWALWRPEISFAAICIFRYTFPRRFRRRQHICKCATEGGVQPIKGTVNHPLFKDSFGIVYDKGINQNVNGVLGTIAHVHIRPVYPTYTWECVIWQEFIQVIAIAVTVVTIDTTTDNDDGDVNELLQVIRWVKDLSKLVYYSHTSMETKQMIKSWTIALKIWLLWTLILSTAWWIIDATEGIHRWKPLGIVYDTF